MSRKRSRRKREPESDDDSTHSKIWVTLECSTAAILKHQKIEVYVLMSHSYLMLLHVHVHVFPQDQGTGGKGLIQIVTVTSLNLGHKSRKGKRKVGGDIKNQMKVLPEVRPTSLLYMYM